jgi:hypothetical protein
MLIVGEHLTKPVRDEVQVASDYRKPMLVFCKDVPTRHLETQELMRTLDVKYDPFTNVVDLQEKVRMSHGYYLLGLIRGDAASTGKLGDCLARLRGFARQRKVVSIFPTVPVCQYNSFTVEDVNTTHVRFQKNGIANVMVPAERIEEVLETGLYEQPVVHLGGRLQWVTAWQNWYFRPERPPSSDPLSIGLGKQVPRNPVFSEQTVNRLQAQPYEFAWSNHENIAGREVFFDEDGRHLTNGGQILT